MLTLIKRVGEPEGKEVYLTYNSRLGKQHEVKAIMYATGKQLVESGYAVSDYAYRDTFFTLCFADDSTATFNCRKYFITFED